MIHFEVWVAKKCKKCLGSLLSLGWLCFITSHASAGCTYVSGKGGRIETICHLWRGIRRVIESQWQSLCWYWQTVPQIVVCIFCCRRKDNASNFEPSAVLHVEFNSIHCRGCVVKYLKLKPVNNTLWKKQYCKHVEWFPSLFQNGEPLIGMLPTAAFVSNTA